ncbi:dol-P-Man:Man(7)GlcNAc(2)-PP-Dol alpha-1,6-mannosyltransferase [Lathyrus oleraceus]|uniref:dol-P-Man:Man(7)GlcNAc(2)-PP-Dol alpha-1,6-mannosyltransferase n=1 Tax=Pisum sativum TaxID=3888 RepID=UPI0021D33475|nr:dol-P-Man:Man(7)GlcNAc(2)-PP-Dol alpha-1,6-mannosyltransferase-like [Pisum sativum]
MVLGCIVLYTLRFLRPQIRDKFGRQVETFFVILTSIQFHFLFYCSRPLPNILALGIVNLAFGYWFQGRFYAALNSLVCMSYCFTSVSSLKLLSLKRKYKLTFDVGFYIDDWKTKKNSVWSALKYCTGMAFLCVGITILVDSIMWKRLLWPEFEVFWFNSVLNKSSEWGTHAFHWYFTSALPRSLLVAYLLSLVSHLLN